MESNLNNELKASQRPSFVRSFQLLNDWGFKSKKTTKLINNSLFVKVEKSNSKTGQNRYFLDRNSKKCIQNRCNLKKIKNKS